MELLVEITFTVHIPPESMYLIVKQQEYIDDMFTRRVITDYSVSKDIRTICLTFSEVSLDEATFLLDNFPLVNFMKYRFKPVEVH